MRLLVRTLVNYLIQRKELSRIVLIFTLPIIGGFIHQLLFKAGISLEIRVGFIIFSVLSYFYLCVKLGEKSLKENEEDNWNNLQESLKNDNLKDEQRKDKDE